MKKMPPPEQRPPVRLSPEERAYFQEVEAHFIRLRGRPLILSPRELERATGWHREGIPLRDVCRGIDRYFEKRFKNRPSARQRAVSLEYCEDYVRQVFEEARRLAVGSGTESVGGGEGVLEQGLGGLLGGLVRARASLADDSSDRLAGVLDRAVSSVQTLLDRARSSETPGEPLTVRETEAELENLDRELVAELRRLAGPAVLEALRASSDAEMREISGKMDPALYQATLERMTLRRLRQSSHIPELSLFAL